MQCILLSDLGYLVYDISKMIDRWKADRLKVWLRIAKAWLVFNDVRTAKHHDWNILNLRWTGLRTRLGFTCNSIHYFIVQGSQRGAPILIELKSSESWVLISKQRLAGNSPSWARQLSAATRWIALLLIIAPVALALWANNLEATTAADPAKSIFEMTPFLQHPLVEEVLLL